MVRAMREQLSLMLSFFLPNVIACEALRTTVETHHAPAFNRDGGQIAYLVRRTQSHHTTGIGFFGGQYTFMRDELTLYTADPKRLRRRSELARWQLPLLKVTASNTGRIDGVLDWSQEKLRYRITFSGFDFSDWPPSDLDDRPLFRVSSNVPKGTPLNHGPTSAEGIRVSLSKDPQIYAYPISNRILVER